MKILFAIACFVIAGYSFKFLHSMKYPKPGTRPSVWATMLVGPISIIAILVGAMGVMAIVNMIKY